MRDIKKYVVDHSVFDNTVELNYKHVVCLGNDVTINGNLYLENSIIDTFPDNLTVNGWIDLRRASASSGLGKGLSAQAITLQGSNISYIPCDAVIGMIYLSPDHYIPEKKYGISHIKRHYIHNHQYVMCCITLPIYV